MIFDHFYMDCNSIIYDIVRSIPFDKTISEYENKIISDVICKIEFFVDMINPSKTVYIAFDGVAPLAKMEQQRSRRYKNVSNITSGAWSTANITPGTEFMKKLSERVTHHFEKDKSGINIVVSNSNETGEGEHKMFSYIRNQDIDSDDTGFVYGLDSDLIMLSIFHCTRFKDFFIFREAPEFAKSLKGLLIEESTGITSCCFMDVVKLSNCILSEMKCECSDVSRIYDYVMLCFFLGNDFLPHFPSLNIRTHGMQILLDTYRLHIGNKPERFFISPISKNIQWNWLRLFIGELAKNEHEFIMNEYDLRKKWDKRTWLTESVDDRDFTLQSSPVIYRRDESYICPSEKGWETRYYKSLFSHYGDGVKWSSEKISEICNNYLEGLEWVFKYYTVDCPDWKWKYNYHYPPLLKDLFNLVPKGDYVFIDKNRGPVSAISQLAYVFPERYHCLIPSVKMRDALKTNEYSQLYPTTYSYKWAFCRYLWEAHVDLPIISEKTIEKLEILSN
jgi:5'-3' exonuclease